MRQTLDRSRTFFVHDYDGVHYDYAAFGDVYTFLAGVKVEAVGTMLPDLDPVEVARMGKESYFKCGDGLKVFVDIAAARGHDAREFRSELHALYHRIGHERTLEQHAGIFAPCADTNRLFSTLRPHIQHGLLTLSCVDNWARPLLMRQERLHYFEGNALIGYAEAGFVSKADSTRPLKMTMDLLGAKPQETVFLEDSLPNLKKAKELDERICTVHVCYGRPQACLPDYVDIQVERPYVLMTQAAALHSPASLYTAPGPTLTFGM